MENRFTFDMPYVGCLIGSAFQRLTIQLEATLKREGLQITAAEYMILRALYSQDGLQQCEIVDMVGKDKSSICRSVASLAKKGFVSTETVRYKCQIIRLTDKAKEIKPLIMRVADERHRALMDIASAKDIKALERVLRAIVN